MSPRRSITHRTDTQQKSVAVEVSSEEYAQFVGQIDLDALWLASARIDNREGPIPPPSLEIAMDISPTYENRDGGFDAFVSYKLRLGSAERTSEIEVTFGLRFSSELPMTRQLFEVFSNVNLPVNTWPFLREFVQSMVTRMNWPALTLPTFKVGTSQPEEEKPRRKRSASE